MAGSVQQIVSKVQSYISGLSGMRSAPASPPDQAKMFPFSLVYPGEGEWTMEPVGWKKALHSIVIEIHVQRRDLPRDFESVVGFCESVPNVLFKELVADKWDATVDTIGPITYIFGVLGYGGIDTIGFKFTVTGVKAQSALT